MSTRVPETVNVWWVNQGRTYGHESRGGYFWAPLQDRRGGTPGHWQRMTEVRRGDIVLHYSEGFIRAVSHVENDAYRAAYPRDSHGEYGQRNGNLVETTYYELEPPVHLPQAAHLKNLPEADNPFTVTFGVKQGYLFVFGVEALVELVHEVPIDWPTWLLDFVASGTRPDTKDDHPVLNQFIDEIVNLNVAVVDGKRMQYKPLLLLAAMRTRLDGVRLDFGSPLLPHYGELCQAIGVDASTPHQPYIHLTSDGLWEIDWAEGGLLSAGGKPGRSQLEGSHASFVGERDTYVEDPRWRPLLFGAVQTHFSRHEWDKLTHVWPELETARSIGPSMEPREGMNEQPALRDLSSVSENFSQALRDSHLRFGPSHDDFVRTFVASLATKPFVILTGLSGSGKTQIALQFGHWLGPGRILVVPVRPDWTGSDALFGYEDALRAPAADGRRAWHAPEPLQFMLQAARDPESPYVLVLDEMNLAYVERYFADVLSGMESGEPTLPNLEQHEDGHWRIVPGEPPLVPVPNNLSIIGTVNVDETTYMFSPKVLDRANTIEFRVDTADLVEDLPRPTVCAPGPEELVRGFLALATNSDFHIDSPHPAKDEIASHLRNLHGMLYDAGFEFGHRVFWESLRFAAMMAAAGKEDVYEALDALVLQKIMPRLHGNRRRLEPVLAALGSFCWKLPEDAHDPTSDGDVRFDPLNTPADDRGPQLPRSFAKIQRMVRNVRVNQFASFAE